MSLGLVAVGYLVVSIFSTVVVLCSCMVGKRSDAKIRNYAKHEQEAAGGDEDAPMGVSGPAIVRYS